MRFIYIIYHLVHLVNPILFGQARSFYYYDSTCNVSKLAARHFIRLFNHSIYCLTYDTLTVDSFSSAQICMENLVRDIYHDCKFLMTKTLNFVKCQLRVSFNSSVCELKIGISFSVWLTAMSVSSKHNGKGYQDLFHSVFFCSLALSLGPT